jgi:hypothetical protein
LNQSAISRIALSTLSLPWMMLRPISTAKSALRYIQACKQSVSRVLQVPALQQGGAA